MNTKLLFIAILSTLFSLLSCRDESQEFNPLERGTPIDYSAESPYTLEDYHLLKAVLNLPWTPLDYTVNLPQYIKDSGLEADTLSNNRATLGRVLFYDKSLSQNGTISCASCHKQEIAFSDSERFSKGFNGAETARNSIALGATINYSTYHASSNRGGRRFLWDIKAANVSEVSLIAFTSPVEMGMRPDELLKVVKSQVYYPVLFEAAFGDPEITEERMLLGLESFVDGIGSYESKFDEGMEAVNGSLAANFDSFTESENRGKRLYFRDCAICHGGKLILSKGYGNNGLDTLYADSGIGRFSTSTIVWDAGTRFKIPGLRNIALSAPYMHDGRFASLKEVVEFYSTNIQLHKDLDEELIDDNGDPVKFNYTDSEVQALVDFLETLTDEKLLTYEKYSDPFKFN